MTRHEVCSWCGTDVDPDDGWRAAEPAGDRVAVFCRLEHVVPWGIQGPHWDAGRLPAAEVAQAHLADGVPCAECGAPVGDVAAVLVRHRGAHRIPDAFCGVRHLLDWARAGGRWR